VNSNVLQRLRYIAVSLFEHNLLAYLTLPVRPLLLLLLLPDVGMVDHAATCRLCSCLPC
jgi:hypothetical protein